MLRLAKSTVQALVRHAAANPDREVCGLVWQSGRGQVVRVVPNVHPQPRDYFRMDPRDVRLAFEVMDADDGEPVAWYHSHPGGKPDPSEADMQGAFDTGMYYLIAHPDNLNAYPGTTSAKWQLSAWECLEPGLLVQAEWMEG